MDIPNKIITLACRYFRVEQQKAQSTIEYILLLTAVVVVVIVFINPQGDFRKTTEKILNQTADQISNMANGINLE